VTIFFRTKSIEAVRRHLFIKKGRAMRNKAILIFAAFVSTAFSVMAPSARSAELVKFDSAPARPYAAANSGPDASGFPIQGYLTKPAGDGPFPAVVLLHSCNGASATRRSRADIVANWGYVALFVDDFTTRGIKETCTTGFGEGVADALGALRFLSTLPYVDTKRIAIVGFSQGAMTALRIASGRINGAFEIPDNLRFRAAAAFYPFCHYPNDRLTVPTLILTGERDDWTPPASCENLAQKQTREGTDIKLVVYPGAFHAFDNPGLAEGKWLFGHWLKYDPDAADRSAAELRSFLESKLTP
jgi:dienelactone hydrolase